MKRVDENLCTHGGDMLAYLYDEMPSADRERFEMHLSDCGTCIDDFAELSQSRYPVYEWKQTEFDPLPTPRIVVPYADPAVSWFDKIRAAVAFSPRFAFGGAATLLLVGIVTGYVLLSGTGGEIAQSVEPSPSPDRVTIAPPRQPEPEITAASDPQTPERTAKPEVVKASVPSKPPARAAKPRAATPAPRKKSDPVPVYSTVEDEQDDSLRLADIFAELDTSD